jgi:hypothetical protein
MATIPASPNWKGDRCEGPMNMVAHSPLDRPVASLRLLFGSAYRNSPGHGDKRTLRPEAGTSVVCIAASKRHVTRRFGITGECHRNLKMRDTIALKDSAHGDAVGLEPNQGVSIGFRLF